MPGRNVRNHLWNKEWVKPRNSITGSKIGNFFFKSFDTADTGPPDHSYSFLIDIGLHNPTVSNSFSSCDDPQLSTSVQFSGLFTVKMILRIEIFYFAGKLRLK